MEVTVRRRNPLTGTCAIGVACAVGVGYVDPGNWATDLFATQWGDALVWSVLASGIAATLLQVLAVRFSAEHDIDLATAIARRWPRTARLLWPSYAGAIVATEIAEFTGLTVGLRLLFDMPAGIATVCAAALLAALVLLRRGSAVLEAFAVVTTALLGVAFAYEWALLHPPAAPVIAGALEPQIASPAALLAIVGIVGATIMPHNLFLHGGLLLQRLRGRDAARRRAAVRAAVRETVFALGAATAINVAILVVGAAIGRTTIEDAYAILAPLAGPHAATLFGVALIAAALAAATSGTLAGDVVCGPRTPLPLAAPARRALAIGPAVLLLACGMPPAVLLTASQVALGLILPAVVVPFLLLAAEGAWARSGHGRILLVSSSLVALCAMACDGILLATLLPKGG